jgi:hypothetical protein
VLVCLDHDDALKWQGVAAKALIAPVVVGWLVAKNGWLLPSDAKPHAAKRFIV